MPSKPQHTSYSGPAPQLDEVAAVLRGFDELAWQLALDNRARALAERLTSLSLRFSQRLPSSQLPSINDESRSFYVWTCAEGCGRIDGVRQYEQHQTRYPKHHPQMSDDVGLPREGRQPSA